MFLYECILKHQTDFYLNEVRRLVRALAFARSFFFRMRLRRASCFKQSLAALDSSTRRSASHCASPLSVSHCFSRTGGREASGLRRNRRWGLDHSRWGGGDRAPRTHLKDALPRATTRPVEIQQRACGIEASGFSIHVWLCARKSITIWYSVSTQHHFTDGRIGKRSGLFLFSQTSRVSRSDFCWTCWLSMQLQLLWEFLVSHLKRVAQWYTVKTLRVPIYFILHLCIGINDTRFAQLVIKRSEMVACLHCEHA